MTGNIYCGYCPKGCSYVPARLGKPLTASQVKCFRCGAELVKVRVWLA